MCIEYIYVYVCIYIYSCHNEDRNSTLSSVTPLEGGDGGLFLSLSLSLCIYI